jgi:hypothetical protein
MTETGSPEFLGSARHYKGLLRDQVMETINAVNALDHLVAPVAIYPDASAKSFGFPSGLRIETDRDHVYPMAAPDLGCGYAVIDTGLTLAAGLRARMATELMLMLEQPTAGVGADAAESMMLESTFPASGDGDWFGENTENVQDWSPSTEGLTVGDLESIGASVGRPTGHFVALYEASEDDELLGLEAGRLVLVVHTGASVIRDVFNRSGFYVEAAVRAVNDLGTTREDAASGRFPIDISTPFGSRFMKYATAARNFGYNNRRAVAARIVETISASVSLRPEGVRVVSHVDHVAFDKSMRGVVARRGLQRIGRSPIFLTGGANTRAYLCSAGAAPNPAARGLIPHGSPVAKAEAVGEPADDCEVADLDMARTTVSNTSPDPGRVLEDVRALDDMASHLIDRAWIASRHTLRPVLNYREAHS